jgi:hypothetical protein
VDIWSEYQARGLWGLWASFFDSSSSGFDLWVQCESSQFSFSSKGFSLDLSAPAPSSPAFRWSSAHGLSLMLSGDMAPAPHVDDFWRVLLEYESARSEVGPTFLPFFFPAPGLTEQLNNLIFKPPGVVLLNGQPGTGKLSVLQSLSLLHGQARIDQRSEALIRQPDACIVPEVALLESSEQQALVKHVRSGGRLWAATVYDIQMLLSRKILNSALVDVLLQNRILLPALSRRDALEVESAATFWRTFYGVAPVKALANLDFHKRRVLGQGALSVESILEEGRGLRGVIAEFEKEAILKAHARVGRSQHKIANLLKVSRGSLQHKLRKYQLESYASSDADTDKDG